MYFDYAANTPVDDEVLDVFVDATKKYVANPNSKHYLGIEARDKISDVSSIISKYFNCDSSGVIYTSGSSEANNLVIKGICEIRKKFGNKIIISALEHSSIIAPCNYLTSHGFDVSVIPIDDNGIIDFDELEKELNDNTVLVSIAAVDSELGTIQPIERIGKLLKKYPNCVFHTDATQAIGKVNICYDDVDFITFAPHKFYGLNGCGVLINRNNVKLIPLVHGGKSTTIYRSGTPVIANVLALEKAFTKALDNLDQRFNYIKELNMMLRNYFSNLTCCHINSPLNSIPNTLNISLINRDTKKILSKLEKNNIYLSTTTACSLDDSVSKSVLSITKDLSLASNTIRISISHLTTKTEIQKFIKLFDKLINE